MLNEYKIHEQERAEQNIPPLPLDPDQTSQLVDLLKADHEESELLLYLLKERVPAGVDQSAYVKAAFLADITTGKTTSPYLSKLEAVKLLGTMLGGYNIQPLIACLKTDDLGEEAANALSKTLLIFDAFNEIFDLSKTNSYAKTVVDAWAEGKWFTEKSEIPNQIKLTVYKVPGEINTDDLSPATDAWSRPDIPLHALAMFKMPREGLTTPLETLETLKEKGNPLVFVGDVVGTGSSRKSATNSVLWHMGDDISCIPNKKEGGFCFGSKIAPIFFNTLEDSGAFPIELDVSNMEMGQEIILEPHNGKVLDANTNEVISTFELKTDVLLDEVRANGRIPLIIGRQLTDKTREALGLEATDIFRRPSDEDVSDKGYTLAQKMVGKACGVTGIRPGTYCEPRMTTVGSQDTTGPMTRDELKELACLGFSADLVMQSFCHTAAYPKPVDIDTQHNLPDFIMNRGGVSLRPGDGIIHSWLNRMLLPDGVGTGGDSHTRFPIGISFPAGSGLVAFAAALGVMPLDMPESVLVRFKGEMQPGITLRDLVNAIPYAAIQSGLLTVAKEGKKNIFSGRCLEIEGLPNMKVEQAFELSDASAERSASGCSVRLNKEPIIEYLKSNIVMLRWMIASGYGDAKTLERRAVAMEEWIENPELLEPDADAEYAEIIEIDLNEITEPLLACPNDPDDIKPLSEVANTEIQEVFIGSCMTNIGHFRAAGTLLEKHKATKARLWVVPPTKMDEKQLMEEGIYNIFGTSGARTELPGCSLCMGNQARVLANSTVVSTSTRNFPNRLGDGANVFLASAELSAIASILGKLPTVEEYHKYMEDINPLSDDIYKYLNFNEIDAYVQSANSAEIPAVNIVNPL
ncbi:bifunctional aconitate hydratase 2/2-methylisocitrate dehydratase [Gammaproteobacteria bacterium]|jgi:aconitate hydratase 2/2-methylisocitrate dehydratase|nr:bifunctional aconitate hydratase 2/2-methylisocitrate dehydratase [Gammaproteobacteria bacterium]MDA7829459.1 bifunctional aconitate hydratase 2/2-methylisocitrate dehydratase [Gammaproteobacteria bacterium]MDA7845179.1 bifunctional aconitate hydratase 2/2-methylisocitrate dehydratase [Gammaproteobacteria bacterium]MDA8955839.1 bifunctional aconitate hydratase 2/2-methylisocitrate dehydratase [Gammaproteobacteria bacterium]MDA9039789.1 bifunctional aconitate hydratase 2/2-methylisocitrate de